MIGGTQRRKDVKASGLCMYVVTDVCVCVICSGSVYVYVRLLAFPC